MSKPLKWSLAVVLCLIWMPITSAFSDWIGGTFLNAPNINGINELGALFTGIITACFLSLGYMPLILLNTKSFKGVKTYGATPTSSIGGLKNWLLNLFSDKAKSELAVDYSPTNDDDQLYEQALIEIENNIKVKSIWARAFASSDNEEDAERLYITLRVNRLKEEHTIKARVLDQNGAIAEQHASPTDLAEEDAEWLGRPIRASLYMKQRKISEKN